MLLSAIQSPHSVSFAAERGDQLHLTSLVALHKHLQERLKVKRPLLLLLDDIQRAIFSVLGLVLVDPFQQKFDGRRGKIETAQVELGDVRL